MDPCSLLVTQTSQSVNSGFRERQFSEDKAESDRGRYPCQPLEYITQYNKNDKICCLLSYKWHIQVGDKALSLNYKI